MTHVRLRRLRRERGLTQTQLSELLDVHQPTVARWERHEAMPRRRARKRLALLFGLPIEELLATDNDDPEVVVGTHEEVERAHC